MRGGLKVTLYRVAEIRGRKGLTLLQAYSLLVTNKDHLEAPEITNQPVEVNLFEKIRMYSE